MLDFDRNCDRLITYPMLMYLSIMYEHRFNMWVILGGLRSWGR